MKKDTHCQRLLKALEQGPVNPLQAWCDLGIYRLGARILDLRRVGHAISRATVAVKNQFGESCRVAEYRLESEA